MSKLNIPPIFYDLTEIEYKQPMVIQFNSQKSVKIGQIVSILFEINNEDRLICEITSKCKQDETYFYGAKIICKQSELTEI